MNLHLTRNQFYEMLVLLGLTYIGPVSLIKTWTKSKLASDEPSQPTYKIAEVINSLTIHSA